MNKIYLAGLAGTISLIPVVAFPQSSETAEKPNIIFIAIDDLNDWVGFLDGNPQTLTPNMDALASQGMVFERAYCAASISNASRAAIMSGFRPSSTGIYGNANDMYASPVLVSSLMLPQWLSMHGYYTLSRGKIYHNQGLGSDTWDEWAAGAGSYGSPAETPSLGMAYNGMTTDEAVNFDWGGTTAKPADTPDYLNAKWAADILENRDFEKPFFLACGIFRPHLSWFVPQEYFDKFPLDQIVMPEVDPNDLSDIPGFSPSGDYNNASKYNLHKEAVQAYLACVNYADDCVGVILDALNNSQYKDNTIVILWGDHGWHLGEKLRYKKFTLWEEATRVPLIIKAPGITNPGSRSFELVNLLDLYPTITDLCGISPNTNNEGKSLMPVLQGMPEISRTTSWTTMGERNYTLRSENRRFIERKGVEEEYYNEIIDPLEHTNLIHNSSYSVEIQAYKSILDSLLFLTKHAPVSVRSNTIPGVIQTEKFDRGGEGNAYHDNDYINSGAGGSRYFRREEAVDIFPCTDIGGGYYVGDIGEGEWLRYTIDTVKSGVYDLTLRIASDSDFPGFLDFYLDNQFVYKAPAVFTTHGGWQDMKFEGIQLPEAVNASLEIHFTGGSTWFNYFNFQKHDTDIGYENYRPEKTLKIYQQPFKGSLHVNVSEFDTEMVVELIDLEGRILYHKSDVIDFVDIPVSESWAKGVYLVRTRGKNKLFSQKVIII